MSANKCRVLVLNWEPDALAKLQGILQPDVEATITWDEVLARKLVKITRFDVILAGKKKDKCTEPVRVRSFPAQSKSVCGAEQRPVRKVA